MKVLMSWAEKCKAWSNEGKNVYFYFDNDIGGFAPHNANDLQKMVQN